MLSIFPSVQLRKWCRKNVDIKRTFQNYKRQRLLRSVYTEVDFKILPSLPLNRICCKLPVSIVSLEPPYIKQENYQKENLNIFHGQVRKYCYKSISFRTHEFQSEFYLLLKAATGLSVRVSENEIFIWGMKWGESMIT